MERLINTKLLMMFLARQQLPIGPEKIDEQSNSSKANLKKDGQDLATAIVQNGISMDNIRKTVRRPAALVRSISRRTQPRRPCASMLADHRDLFSGTQIRASHILIKVEPDAPAAEKEKAKQKLLQIKKDIEGGTITFAAAANKFSQDEANSGGAGGDLDYFTLGHGIRRGIHRRRLQAQEGRDLRPRRNPLRLPPDPGHRPQRGQSRSTSSRTSPTSCRNTATSCREMSSTPNGSGPRSTSSRCPRTSSRSQAPSAPAAGGRRGAEGGARQRQSRDEREAPMSRHSSKSGECQRLRPPTTSPIESSLPLVAQRREAAIVSRRSRRPAASAGSGRASLKAARRRGRAAIGSCRSPWLTSVRRLRDCLAEARSRTVRSARPLPSG